VPLAGIVVAGFIALIVALTALGWWYHAYSVNREARIQRGSFNFQTTAQEQVVKLAADIATVDAQVADPTLSADQKAALRAQRKAIAANLCSTAGRITQPEPAVAAIIGKEC
jgi:hypothetical protein